MIQRLRAPPRRLDKDGQVLLGLLLPDVLRQRVGAQRALIGVLAEERFGHDRLFIQIGSEINAHVRPPPYFIIFFSACRMMSSSGSASMSISFSTAAISALP